MYRKFELKILNLNFKNNSTERVPFFKKSYTKELIYTITQDKKLLIFTKLHLSFQ